MNKITIGPLSANGSASAYIGGIVNHTAHIVFTGSGVVGDVDISNDGVNWYPYNSMTGVTSNDIQSDVLVGPSYEYIRLTASGFSASPPASGTVTLYFIGRGGCM